MTQWPEDICPSCNQVTEVRQKGTAFRLLDRETTLTEHVQFFECDHCGETSETKSTFYQDAWNDPEWDEGGITV